VAGDGDRDSSFSAAAASTRGPPRALIAI